MLVQLKLKSFGKVMKLKFGKDIAQAQAVENWRDGACELPLIITLGSRLLCMLWLCGCSAVAMRLPCCCYAVAMRFLVENQTKLCRVCLIIKC